MRSQIRQRDSADEGVGMTWVNCKLITAPHQNSEACSCVVWVPYL